jgi:hypothetical protein
VRVVFYGGRHLNNLQRVYEAYQTLREQGLAEVYVTDEPGAPVILAEIARSHDIDVRVVEPNWRLYGKRAEERARHALLGSAPDMVVLFPNPEAEVAQMELLANTLDIPVWDLRGTQFIEFGSLGIPGAEPMPYDEQPF